MAATWVGRSLIAILLAAIIVVPVGLRPVEVELPSGTRKLVVLTPHNEQIRYEFGRGFRLWHEKLFGETVDVDWRKVGGTGDILRLLEAQYRTLAQSGREDEGAGYDIVWGGGDYFFDKQLKRGFTIDDGKGDTRNVSMTQPTSLGEDFVKAAFPNPMIADRPLRDPQGHWWGIAL